MKETQIKIIYSPGCFDEFEGTQAELDQLLRDIQRMATSGELFNDDNRIYNEGHILNDIELDDLEVMINIESNNRNKRLH